MLLIGLTGSIGMGKTETARMFSALGVPAYDADAAVHALYAPGGAAVEAVASLFPGVVRDGGVDRTALSAQVVGKPEALKQLEAIVHPLVRAEQQRWLETQAKNGIEMVVLDIPLLLEARGRAAIDVVVVVSAPGDIQRKRVLERPGMTEEKLEVILKKQMPDAEKRRHADFIVETDKGLDHARDQVKKIVAALKGRKGHIWKPPAEQGG